MTAARDERRQHRRHPLPCPVSFQAPGAGAELRSKSLNISDGGLLVSVGGHQPPPPGSRMNVQFSVPRTTPNTYLLERFRAPAIVVRHEGDPGDGSARVAVRFETPLQLGLDV